ARELASLRDSIEAMVRLLQDRYEAVRASETKYRDIVDYSPIGISQGRPDGTLVMVNEALAHILGYGGDVPELMQLNAAAFFVDRQERARLIAQYGPIGHAERIEARMKRRDGTPFWVELSSHVV